MYRVAVQRDFIAQHYLFGGDWGAENEPHSHRYVLELELSGKTLNQHNYLVDIDHIKESMAQQVNYYQDRLLNDLPEFASVNPSVEHFSRMLCEALSRKIDAENISRVTVRLWENQDAWASYEVER